MKIFYVVFILSCLVFLGITFYFKSESTQFYGIADTKEIIISAEESVEVKEISVVQGQMVKAGDTLVVLNQPVLSITINEISHTLDEYKALKKHEENFSKSEIRKYVAEQEERANEIAVEIRELEAQYEMNKRLVSELRGIKKEIINEKYDSFNPIKAQIKSLKILLESVRNPAQIEMNRLRKDLFIQNNPLDAQIQRYTQELALLQEKQNSLIKCAQIDGVIGMVKFKPGENVSPFDTILTLHTKAPSFAKGFIHEKLYSRVSIGDTVTIRSVTDKNQVLFGTIAGVGSRIVEYPYRLLKRADIPVWGREVLVKLPNNNTLLLGEKVQITPFTTIEITLPLKQQKQEIPAEKNTSDLSHSTTYKGDYPLRDIRIRDDLVIGNIEASGLFYLSDLNSFILLSDETDKKRPELFLMDSSGFAGEKIAISGLLKINDMESITSADQKTFYVLCSQSYNKKGKHPQERKLFVRVRRDGKKFSFDKSVYLYDLLRNVSTRTKNLHLAEFLSQGMIDKSIDIEGMTIYNDTLLLGFKNPRINNSAVILSIASYNDIFERNQLSEQQISIWDTIPIYDRVKSVYCGISELVSHNNKLYGLSTGVTTSAGIEEDAGLFWEYTPSTKELMVIQAFPGLKPEGLAFNQVSGRFLIVFDNGSKNPSQFVIIKG
ncbi:MAG: DUF3616 domain-containing protein [Chitinispirillaceae bacterium]|nr:DUF3616 domain-containing protein [Chitinispirillaceae bacterium]